MLLLSLLSAISVSASDESLDSYKSRFSSLASNISSRTTQLADTESNISSLTNNHTARSAALTNLSRPPDGLSAKLKEVEDAIDNTIASHLNEAAAAHFTDVPGPDLTLISAETPEFAEVPPLATQFWRALDPKTKIPAVPPLRLHGEFWSFPGSSGRFVFHAPQISRISKVFVPAPGNATACGLRSYRFEFSTRPGRTVYGSPVYAQFGVIGLDRAVWFRDVTVFVNASIQDRDVCAPKIRVFDDSVPRKSK
jgi:hypothetical protein